jgi:hypothetical protein
MLVAVEPYPFLHNSIAHEAHYGIPETKLKKQINCHVNRIKFSISPDDIKLQLLG